MHLSKHHRKALEWARDKPNKTGFEGFAIFDLVDKGLVKMSGSSDDVTLELTDAGRKALSTQKQ